MNKANAYILNINRLLKKAKSNTSVGFIHTVKDLNDIDHSNIKCLRLPHSKCYLKILGIPYFVKDTNLPIFSNIVETVIKSIHIFNNITLTSYSHIIKVSPKLDIVIIWIDIWDFQNRMNVKMLINRYFNITGVISPQFMEIT